MIWLVSFGLSAGFIAAGAVCFFIRRKQGKNEVRYLGAGVFLASVTACYPVMRLSEQVGFAAAMSVSQGIRMFVVDTGVSDILKDLNADVLGNLFYLVTGRKPFVGCRNDNQWFGCPLLMAMESRCPWKITLLITANTLGIFEKS